MMRSLWLRIGAGALAIFVVGYGGVLAARRLVDRGRSLFESSDPITIPLAFVPFTLDGKEAGRFQRVTIRREAPKVVEGFDLRVRLAEAMDPAVLKDCRLVPVDGSDLDLERGFTCLASDAADSGWVPFGTVRFAAPGGLDLRIPLLLDSAAVADLRRSGHSVVTTRARFSAEQAAAAGREAGRVTTEVRALAESVKASVRVEVSVPPPPPER